MYQRILVPLDGSKQAERAIPVASRLARVFGGSLVLLRVVPPPVEFGKYARQHSVAWERAIYETQHAQAASYLVRTLLLHTADLVGIEVEIEVATGLTAQTLVIAAQKKQVDLFVMCGGRKPRLQAHFFGSLTQEIAHRSPVPVLALHEDGALLDQASPLHPWRILVVLDGSPLAETALAPAISLASVLNPSQGGDFHLLLVMQAQSGREKRRGKRNREQVIQEAEQYLKEVTVCLCGTYPESRLLSLTTSLTMSGDVAGALAKPGQEKGYDLVVLAHARRKSLGRLLKHSIAEHILNATALPLLLIHPLETKDTSVRPVQRRIGEI